MPLVRMKAAPVKTDGERLGNEFMNGAFFSALVKGPSKASPVRSPVWSSTLRAALVTAAEVTCRVMMG